MTRLKFLGKKAGFVLAVVGAAVVGGTTTALVTAAIPSSNDGQIHGCYRNSGNILNPKGSLRVVDSESNETCTTQETTLHWPATSGGGQHSIAYAMVDANGNLVASYTTSEVLSVKRILIGGNPPYQVYYYCFDLSFKPKNGTYATPNNDIKGTWVSGGSATDVGAIDGICGTSPSYDALASGVGGEVTIPEKFTFSN